MHMWYDGLLPKVIVDNLHFRNILFVLLVRFYHVYILHTLMWINIEIKIKKPEVFFHILIRLWPNCEHRVSLRPFIGCATAV